MKFYIFKEQSRKAIVAEKLEPGKSPSALHVEVKLPSSFFMQLPNGLMERRVNNNYNASLQERIERNGGRGYISSFKTKYGNHPTTNPIGYQNHLDIPQGLTKLEATHIEEFKIDYPENYQAELRDDPETAARGTELVKVKRHLAKGASISTIRQACRDSNIANVTFVGFATFPKQPDMLFVTNDLNHVQQLLTSCNATDSSPIRRYTQWVWYYTHEFKSSFQYIIDLLAQESLSDQIEFISLYGKPLDQDISSYHGKPMRQEIEQSFSEMNINLGGDAKTELMDSIMGYIDDHEVSVCDVIQTLNPPTLTTMCRLELSTDKAYVRTGQCGIIKVDASPLGKMLSAYSMDELREQINKDFPQASPEDLQRNIDASLIPVNNRLVSHLYLVSPQGIFYTANLAEPITADHQLTADSRLIGNVTDMLEDPLTTMSLRTVSLREQVRINELLNHEPKIRNKIFFIDRTLRLCQELPNIKPEMFKRFDAALNISVRNDQSRVLFFYELDFLKNYLKHDFEALVEAAGKAAEEKKSVELQLNPPVMKTSVRPEQQLEVLKKKIYSALILNSYASFCKQMQTLMTTEQRDELVAAVRATLKSSTNLFNIKNPELQKRFAQFHANYSTESSLEPAKKLMKIR